MVRSNYIMLVFACWKKKESSACLHKTAVGFLSVRLITKMISQNCGKEKGKRINKKKKKEVEREEKQNETCNSGHICQRSAGSKCGPTFFWTICNWHRLYGHFSVFWQDIYSNLIVSLLSCFCCHYDAMPSNTSSLGVWRESSLPARFDPSRDYSSPSLSPNPKPFFLLCREREKERQRVFSYALGLQHK